MNQIELKEIKKNFNQIIGYESIKSELVRVCDVLVNKEKYDKFGVKVSQGLMLYGDAGVGKSLMAECFISAVNRKSYICRKTKSNVGFIDEITRIFEDAKANAPSLILLDDLDKFANEDDNHIDAEEYVAVQAGIDSVKNDDVFVFATANNIYKLPNSLRRNGRFSKLIEINPPEGKDAEKIIEFYLSKKKRVGDINIKEIARLLEGRTCADLEVVVNEAGVMAAYENKEKIEHNDMIRACLRVMYSAPEKQETGSFISTKKDEKVAYHEAGHAVIAEILEPESVTLCTIADYVSDTAGLTSVYVDNDYYDSFEYRKNRVRVLLGGKAATEIKFKEVDVGTREDLRNAYRIVSKFDNDYCCSGFEAGARYFDYATELVQDKHCKNMTEELEKAYIEAKEIILKNIDFFEKIARKLIEKTTIKMSEIQEIKKTCTIVR